MKKNAGVVDDFEHTESLEVKNTPERTVVFPADPVPESSWR